MDKLFSVYVFMSFGYKRWCTTSKDQPAKTDIQISLLAYRYTKQLKIYFISNRIFFVGFVFLYCFSKLLFVIRSISFLWQCCQISFDLWVLKSLGILCLSFTSYNKFNIDCVKQDLNVDGFRWCFVRLISV